jgi:dihydrofolate reductase
MRKIVLLMHVSLDGYVAGPNGEMDWIKLDDSLWDYVTSVTDAADTALFGANTYRIMEAYWPTAAEQPNASKHDVDHAKWVNAATKLVFSKTLEKTDWQGTRIIDDAIKEEMTKLKEQPGKNLVMLGSPSLAQSFMQMGLIDELRLNVNPVILGAGRSLFDGVHQPINLSLAKAETFGSGVLAVTYKLPTKQ